MLFGQSAGAFDAYTLATLPNAPSLFSSAICESGGGRDLASAVLVAPFMEGYVADLNCSVSDVSIPHISTTEDIISSRVGCMSPIEKSCRAQCTHSEPDLSGWD